MLRNSVETGFSSPAEAVTKQISLSVSTVPWGGCHVASTLQVSHQEGVWVSSLRSLPGTGYSFPYLSTFSIDTAEGEASVSFPNFRGNTTGPP